MFARACQSRGAARAMVRVADAARAAQGSDCARRAAAPAARVSVQRRTRRSSKLRPSSAMKGGSTWPRMRAAQAAPIAGLLWMP
jgi:hypothetical protein